MTRTPGSRLWPLDPAALCRALAIGATPASIAVSCGVTPDTVRRAIAALPSIPPLQPPRSRYAARTGHRIHPRLADILLTRAGAATLLCVTPGAVTRLADAGTLPFTRSPGGHRRYRYADVRALQEQHRPQPPNPASGQEGHQPVTRPEPSVPSVGAELASRLGDLQCLDDATAWRQSRLDAPCAACVPGAACHDHASDAALITRYRERQQAIFDEATAGADPADLAALIGDGTCDGEPLSLVGVAVNLAILTRLRHATAAGPAVADIGAGPALITQEGPAIIEYPLCSAPEDIAG
jgi:excisionase family DNA binding protein